MARGHQKELAQQKNAAKNAAQKKGVNQKKAAGAALVHQCDVCKVTLYIRKGPTPSTPSGYKKWQKGV